MNCSFNLDSTLNHVMNVLDLEIYSTTEIDTVRMRSGRRGFRIPQTEAAFRGLFQQEASLSLLQYEPLREFKRRIQEKGYQPLGLHTKGEWMILEK